MPNIPSVKVGNIVFDIKDTTAREHLVEVSAQQPTSSDNKLWIKEQEEEFLVPSYAEFLALKARVDRLDPQ